MPLTTDPVGVHGTKATMPSGDKSRSVAEAVDRALAPAPPAEVRELCHTADLLARIDRGEVAMPAGVADSLRANLAAATQGGPVVRAGAPARIVLEAADRFAIHAAYHEALEPGADVPPLSASALRPLTAGRSHARSRPRGHARPRGQRQRRRSGGTRSTRGPNGEGPPPPDLSPDAIGAPPRLPAGGAPLKTESTALARNRAYPFALAGPTLFTTKGGGRRG